MSILEPNFEEADGLGISWFAKFLALQSNSYRPKKVNWKLAIKILLNGIIKFVYVSCCKLVVQT